MYVLNIGAYLARRTERFWADNKPPGAQGTLGRSAEFSPFGRTVFAPNARVWERLDESLNFPPPPKLFFKSLSTAYTGHRTYINKQ